MRAITFDTPGGPENLSWTEVPEPVVGDGEVLIDVVAAGVNRADLLQRRGHYDPPPGTSPILGLEVSGRIAEVGAGVSGWSLGEPCVALLAGGGYAERVAVPAGQVVRAPAGVDPVVAGGLIEVAATVVSNLAEADLRAGEVLLVHGGAGGIGGFAVSYATALGATVVATAGTAEKLARCRELGAAAAIDYHDDWPAALRKVTDGHGADVVLDVMGASYLTANVGSLALGGRLMIIGLQGGTRGELDLSRLMRLRARVAGTTLRARPVSEKAAICARVAAEVWPRYMSGALPLPAVTRFPITAAADAHRLLESGRSSGKIVLSV